MNPRWSAILIVFLMAGSLGWRCIYAQGAEQYTSPETGHTVSGEFLLVFESVSNPKLIYGEPMTEAFIDPTTGLLVQYFLKARFELHPEVLNGQRVRLTPLGKYLYVPGKPYTELENPLACREFSETGYRVCYDFLSFYQANGGRRQFGLPTSSMELLNGYIVQFFEYARLEWHPELPVGQRIIVADLGKQYFYTIGEDPSRLLPPEDSNTIHVIRSLRVRAYPENAVTGVSGRQTVHILVQDQLGEPVPNTRLILTVHYPSGEERIYPVSTLTDPRGIAQFNFPIEVQSTGRAEIHVSARYESLQTESVTSFQVWW
jgi:hypothetical protein